LGLNISLDQFLRTPSLVRESFSENDTLELSKALGALLRAGDWINLVGDLGAGKTSFVKGLGEALHCAEPVRSPTFTLIQTYKAKSPRHPALNHVDLYRMDAKTIPSLEWDTLMTNGAVTVVEWAEKARPFWPLESLVVRMLHEGLDRRKIEFFAIGKRPADLIKALKSS
jgi:tRNA threonylcarbamoyladenosine biosynthesis protein TsaE